MMNFQKLGKIPPRAIISNRSRRGPQFLQVGRAPKAPRWLCLCFHLMLRVGHIFDVIARGPPDPDQHELEVQVPAPGPPSPTDDLTAEPIAIVVELVAIQPF